MYSTLTVDVRDGVARVALSNPPVNTLNARMMIELHDLLGSLRDDPAARVIVFSSADDEFFLAHVDMTILDHYEELADVAAKFPDVNVHQGIGELLRHQPQVTIVKLAGIARSGGAEFVVAADMTFAARETARIGQTEALLGIVPGGGGTQYLLDRVGRNRALEIVLSADAIDADTAALYGWINRAIPAADLDAYVDRIAADIAALDPAVIAAAKRILPPPDLTAGLNAEHEAWSSLVTGPTPAAMFEGAMKHDMQTRERERDVEPFLRSIAAGLS